MAALIGRHDLVEHGEMGTGGKQLGAELGDIVEGQRPAKDAGEGANDLPVLAGFARREDGARGHLRPALGVDVKRVLLGIGGAGKNDIGAVGAAVAMAPLIDDEGAAEPLDLDLVGAKEIDHVDIALLRAVQDRLDVPAPPCRGRSRDRGRRREQPRCGAR